MNHSDIAALMKGAAPAIADLLARTVQPLTDRIASLEQELASLRAIDHAEALAKLVDTAIGALPTPRNGNDADPAETRRMVDEAVQAAVAALPPAEPGKPGSDVDMAEVERLIEDHVAAAMRALPPAEPGKSVTVEDVAPVLKQLVAEEIAKLPPPEPGKSLEIGDVSPMIEDLVAKAVAAIPPAEPGKPGAPGKLPLVSPWEDRVYYEGDCCLFEGSTYQAKNDTGRAPTHEDWVCIAKAGRDGENGRSLRVRGTYEAETTYEALDIVALNGGAFVARKDDPGHCPGEGWQMVASRGKPGAPGEARKGDPGRSIKGDPGDPVVSAEVSDDGVLTLINGDGSTVQCDLYPLLRKVSGVSDA